MLQLRRFWNEKKQINPNKLIFRKLSTHFFLYVASFTQGPPIPYKFVTGIRLQQAAQDLLPRAARDLEFLRLETMLGKSKDIFSQMVV